MLGDDIRGYAPTFDSIWENYKSGLIQGGIAGAVFGGGALFTNSKFLSELSPLAKIGLSTVGGAALFPAAKTLLLDRDLSKLGDNYGIYVGDNGILFRFLVKTGRVELFKGRGYWVRLKCWIYSYSNGILKDGILGMSGKTILGKIGLGLPKVAYGG